MSSTKLLHLGSFAALAVAFAACSASSDTTFDANETPEAGVTSGDGSTDFDAGGPAANDAGDAGGDASIPVGGPEDVCPGVAVALAKVDGSTLYTAHVASNTTSLYNHYSASCGGGSGADAVYRIDPPMTGRATVKVTAAFAAIVSARSGCDDAKTELACSDGDTLAFPVFEGKPVFVVVDGYGGTKGEVALDIEVQTAVCGNGKAEFPETCDDGNTTSGDGCSATCTMEDVGSTSACPGMGFRLKPGTASFAGDTATLANGGGSATGCLSTGSGNNATYAITPTVTGNLALSLLAAYPDALLHVRRECSANATQVDCVGSEEPVVPLTTSVPVKAEETVWVFVDSGSSSKEGPYVLDATLTAASCSNGKVDGDEECDDGNADDGDGCSSTCTIEPDPATYTCPGKVLRLEGATHTLKVRGATVASTSKWTTCGSSAPDVVYQVSSDIAGYLTAKVKGDFNTGIAVRTACPGSSDLACAKTAPGNAEEIVHAPMDQDKAYFIVVDSATSGRSGTFELELSVVPSVCGNGVVEGGETCDDGALDGGDGCDATCHLETEKARDDCATAPPIVFEAKTDGTYAATLASGTTNLTKPSSPTHSLSPCSSTKPDAWFAITAPITGVLTARITSATFETTIGVRTACAPSGTQLTCDGTEAFGGQEIVFPVTEGLTYYFGVSGHNSSVPAVGRFTASFDLVPTGCGDTILNSNEECDDGNLTSGDGCSSTCTVETLAGANACPGHTLALTGATASATRFATVTVDTAGLPAKTGSACGGSGPEAILALTSDVDGQLSIKSTATYSAIVYARETCADPATEITRKCSSLGTFATTIKKNTPYYVFVDGMAGASGVAKLSITVTP